MISTVLWLLFDFLPLKIDVKVPSKSNMQKNFAVHWRRHKTLPSFSMHIFYLIRSGYEEHLHRLADLQSSLTRIQREEGESVDKTKVQEIVRSFACFRI